MFLAILAAALTGQCAGGGCGAGYGYAYRPAYTLPAYGYCTYQPPSQMYDCTPYTWYTYAPTAAVPTVEARHQTGSPNLPSPQAPQAPPKSTP